MDDADRALIERASAGQVMAALSAAIKAGEVGAAAELIGILATKDPDAADLIIKTIQYREPRTEGTR